MNSTPQDFPRGDGTPAARPVPTEGGYALEVRTSWSEFLATLPGDARILDIGIGNHVAALIAADMSTTPNRGWTIDAIDPRGGDRTQASHDQDRQQPITFHPGAGPARLPFEDATFDAVCGHHSLEFSVIPITLAEIHRVLRPGSEAQFVIHHADSPLVAAARLAMGEADLIFTQTKAFRRLHRLATMGQIVPGTTLRATNDLRVAIRTLKRGLEIARQQGGGRVLATALDGIRKLLAARREMKPDAAGLEIDRVETELRGWVRELGELVKHARTDQDMHDVERVATRAGFGRIERIPLLHTGDQPMGWQLLLHRP